MSNVPTRDELVSMQARHLDLLFGLAQALSDNALPLAMRAAYVQRELALVCKELLAASAEQQSPSPSTAGDTP